MLSDIIIKEEPLDPAEDLQQQMDESKTMLMNKQIMLNDLKASYEENGGILHAGNLQIVEEEADVITVNASDLKSEDELKFIENLKNRTNLPDVCSMCLETFSNKAEYMRHINLKICLNEKRCTVCSIDFSNTKLLFSHLNLHRENFNFCSMNCGGYFKKLHDCIHHEVVEHGIKKVKRCLLNKIKQSEYVCSFCREIFKSELQLHVHWLDKIQGCGKAMQDVTLKLNNLNASRTALPMVTMPITKLRLKTSLPDTAKRMPLNAIINDDSKNHNLIDDNINTEANFKIEIKEEPQDESEISYSNRAIVPEVIIKTEVEDNDNKCTDDKSEIQRLITESKIQTTTSIQEKEFLLNEKLNSLNPIPINLPIFTNNPIVANPQNANNSNEIIQLVPNVQLIKLTTTPITSTAAPTINGCSSIPPLQPIQSNNNNNFKLFNLSTNNLQILQLPPNTQLINLQDMKTSPSVTNTTLANQKAPQPIIIKLQTKPLSTVTSANTSIARPLPLTSPPPLTSIFNTNLLKTNTVQNTTPGNIAINAFHAVTTAATDLVNTNKSVNYVNSSHFVNTANAINTSNVVSSKNTSDTNVNVSSNSLGITNRKLDLGKSQGVTTELAKVDDNRKNFVIPKQHLIEIERLPEKKQLIEKMIKQMKQAESLQTNMKTEPMTVCGDDAYINDSCTSESKLLTPHIENVFPIANQKTGPPPTLYVPILSSTDVEMVQARFEYPEYNYQLICPYCLKNYELKRSLKCHLSKIHNLTPRDLQKICVQAKPFKKNPTDKVTVEKSIIKKKAKKTESQPNIQPSITETSNQQDDLNCKVNSEASNVNSQNPDESLLTLSVPLTSTKAIKTSVFNKIRYICSKCGRQCSSKAMLKDHILANCSRKPQYECPECPKKFFSHGTLQCHKTIHTGELPFKCDYCDKRFRTRGQVTVHHRTHTGERPFVCQVCSMRFTHRETLIAHLSRHIGMKRYKCYGCDKNFSCISALKTHREIRPDTCGKVKFNPRAIGPRVRVIRGNVVFEPQPEINPYLRTEDPKTVLSELQNQQG